MRRRSCSLTSTNTLADLRRKSLSGARKTWLSRAPTNEHVPGKQQKSMSKRLTAKLTPYGFVLPALIVLLAFKVGPVLVSIYGSMFKTGAKNVTFFVGLKN